MPWLEYFYDAEGIQPGEDFRKVLEEGVIESMLLVLRTDIFDLRVPRPHTERYGPVGCACPSSSEGGSSRCRSGSCRTGIGK
jgi:hypothetical protein